SRDKERRPMRLFGKRFAGATRPGEPASPPRRPRRPTTPRGLPGGLPPARRPAQAARPPPRKPAGGPPYALAMHLSRVFPLARPGIPPHRRMAPGCRGPGCKRPCINGYAAPLLSILIGVPAVCTCLEFWVAFTSVFTRLRDRGLLPRHQLLDNSTYRLEP